MRCVAVQNLQDVLTEQKRQRDGRMTQALSLGKASELSNLTCRIWSISSITRFFSFILNAYVCVSIAPCTYRTV